jgi:hypothetical protein
MVQTPSRRSVLAALSLSPVILMAPPPQSQEDLQRSAQPADALDHMDDDSWGSLSQEIIRSGPSESAWLGICALFAAWPRSDARAKALGAASERLRHWDDAVRTLSSDWRDLYQGDQLSDVASLAATIVLYRRESTGSAEMMAIATSQWVRELRRLRIVRSEMNGVAWRLMIESPNLRNLRELAITNTTLGLGRLSQLFTSRAFPLLRSLEVSRMDITAGDVSLLAGGTPFPVLATLDLSGNILGDDGARSLSESQLLRQLEHLAVRANFLGLAGARSLVLATHAERLKSLDLSENKVPPTSVPELERLAAQRGMRLIV